MSQANKPNHSPETCTSALHLSTEAARSFSVEVSAIDYALTGCGRSGHRLPHRAVEFRAVISRALQSAAAAQALVPLVGLGGFDPVGVQRVESALNRLAARLHNVIAHGLTVREGKVEVARLIDELNLVVGWARAFRSEAHRRLDAFTFASLDAKLDEIDTGITALEVQ